MTDFERESLISENIWKYRRFFFFGKDNIGCREYYHGTIHADDSSIVVFNVRRKDLESYPAYKDGTMPFYLDSCFDGTQTGGIEGSPAVYTYSNVPRKLLGNHALKWNVKNGRITSVESISLP